MTINELLQKVEFRLLKRILSNIPVEYVKDYIDNASESTSNFIVAFFGDRLFRFAPVRHGLLTLFPLEELNGIAKKYNLPTTKFVYDTALAISNLPWSTDSDAPQIFKELFANRYPEVNIEQYIPFNTCSYIPTVEDNINFRKIELFNYQKSISEQLFNLLLENAARAMIQMPTGSGKTFTAMSAVSRYFSDDYKSEKMVIWLAHSEELCEQAISSFKRAWLNYGNKSIRTYRLWASHNFSVESIQSGIVIASLQKLYSLKRNKSKVYDTIAKRTGAIIFDEAHKASAPTYKELIEDLTSINGTCSLIGLSATPGREKYSLKPIENWHLYLIIN